MNQQMPFDYSAWIWCNREAAADEYGEFYSKFEYRGEDRVRAVISADSNYAIYINGKLATEGQYADYPYDKVYDEVDLTDFCRRGENHLAIVAWYYGLPSCSTYYLGQAALRFAVWDGDTCVCISGSATQSRLSRAYRQHVGQIITGQLGLTFAYDATAEDGWMEGRGADMNNSCLIRYTPKLRPRPCKKLDRMPVVGATEIKRLDDGAILYDLGREEVGFLTLDIHSKIDQELIISYGEHIVDGRVRRKIGSRDFSVTYRAKQGGNGYTNPFRRLGCRYLEISAEDPTALTVVQLGIIPTMYPLTEQTPPQNMSDVQKQIYDTCIRTLRLCMHEHYEDCPWREQSLYAMDSRNQIISGYHAFAEYEFPRANLELIAHDNREDGLLAICYPSSFQLAIPSFSLHFITEAQEYLAYTGDKDFLSAVYPKMQSVLEVFLGLVENGVAKSFISGGNPRYWNFYEWRPGLSGSLSKNEDKTAQTPDLILNTLIICSLERMAWVARELGMEDVAKDYDAKRAAMIPTVRDYFRREDLGVFVNRADRDQYSQLGNSLAILAGLVEGEDAKALAEKILSDDDMTPISLSMQCFKYDALLKVSEEYKDFILEDIEKIYVPMLDGGTGTVWETEVGEADFGRAGSLCHGWSAMPVYYYHKLLKA